MRNIIANSGGSGISRWGAPTPLRGHQLLTRALFGGNVCENRKTMFLLGGRTSSVPWIRQWPMFGVLYILTLD